MPSLGTFAAEFANTTTHADQKRSIVRSALIDQFRPRHAATLGELIHSFEAIASDAKRSLSMYMAEFSVKKVTAEVERQNLRSEEHTSELQSLMRISYAVFCLKKKNKQIKTNTNIHTYTHKQEHTYKYIHITKLVIK